MECAKIGPDFRKAVRQRRQTLMYKAMMRDIEKIHIDNSKKELTKKRQHPNNSAENAMRKLKRTTPLNPLKRTTPIMRCVRKDTLEQMQDAFMKTCDHFSQLQFVRSDEEDDLTQLEKQYNVLLAQFNTLCVQFEQMSEKDLSDTPLANIKSELLRIQAFLIGLYNAAKKKNQDLESLKDNISKMSFTGGKSKSKSPSGLSDKQKQAPVKQKTTAKPKAKKTVPKKK